MDTGPISKRLIGCKRPLQPSEQLWIKKPDHELSYEGRQVLVCLSSSRSHDIRELH